MTDPLSKTSRHTTMWEDGQTVAVKCDGVDVDFILSCDEPRTCPRCYMTIRLVWNVRIEEVLE
jgi:hypothetical protein